MSIRTVSRKGSGDTIIMGGAAPYKEFMIVENQQLPTSTSSPINYFNIGTMLQENDPANEILPATQRVGPRATYNTFSLPPGEWQVQYHLDLHAPANGVRRTYNIEIAEARPGEGFVNLAENFGHYTRGRTIDVGANGTLNFEVIGTERRNILLEVTLRDTENNGNSNAVQTTNLSKILISKHTAEGPKGDRGDKGEPGQTIINALESLPYARSDFGGVEQYIDSDTYSSYVNFNDHNDAEDSISLATVSLSGKTYRGFNLKAGTYMAQVSMRFQVVGGTTDAVSSLDVFLSDDPILIASQTVDSSRHNSADDGGMNANLLFNLDTDKRVFLYFRINHSQPAQPILKILSGHITFIKLEGAKGEKGDIGTLTFDRTEGVVAVDNGTQEYKENYLPIILPDSRGRVLGVDTSNDYALIDKANTHYLNTLPLPNSPKDDLLILARDFSSLSWFNETGGAITGGKKGDVAVRVENNLGVNEWRRVGTVADVTIPPTPDVPDIPLTPGKVITPQSIPLFARIKIFSIPHVLTIPFTPTAPLSHKMYLITDSSLDTAVQKQVQVTMGFVSSNLATIDRSNTEGVELTVNFTASQLRTMLNNIFTNEVNSQGIGGPARGDKLMRADINFFDADGDSVEGGFHTFIPVRIA